MQFCNFQLLFRYSVISLAFLGGSLFVFAQEPINSEDAFERREELKAQMQQIQQEIEQYRGELKEKQKQEKGLSGEIAILKSKIKKTELELSQTALALRSTELSIESNKLKIEDMSQKIETQKEVLASLMQAMYEEDSRGIVELIMSAGDISDFVEHQKFLESIQFSIYAVVNNVKQAKHNLQEEQRVLEEEREEQSRLKSLQEAQKMTLKGNKQEKDRLLNFTKDEKAQFEKLLAQKERDIEQIKNQIFLLEGAGISMSLAKAYEIAGLAAGKTGVRPAFLLAVLKQESSWGANVGQCYLVDAKTGMGKGKNTGSPYSRTMKASRDVQPFLQITNDLGRDPYSTLVSCPHPEYGYGGAMGPAQFLPSVWLAHRDELAGLVGHMPDPWDIYDSFTASALKLSRNGASAQTPDAEWKAAMIYYAGSRWNNPVYSFYGDSVMDLSAAIQNEIDAMGG